RRRLLGGGRERRLVHRGVRLPRVPQMDELAGGRLVHRAPFGARLAVIAIACGTACAGPKAVIDWRMQDRTLDVETDQRGAGDADTPGPDGIVDDYDNAQGRLIPAVNGNISTK